MTTMMDMTASLRSVLGRPLARRQPQQHQQHQKQQEKVNPYTPSQKQNGRPQKPALLLLATVVTLFIVMSVLSRNKDTATSEAPLLLPDPSRPAPFFSSMSPADAFAGVSSPQYALAYQESFGFFDRVSQDNWIRRRDLANRRQNYPTPNMHVAISKRAAPSAWHQLNWDPTFRCPYTELIGSTSEGVYVCDTRRIQQMKQLAIPTFASTTNTAGSGDTTTTTATTAASSTLSCVIYLVGVRIADTMVYDTKEKMPGCQVHLFRDPNPKRQPIVMDGVTEHNYTLQSTFRELPEFRNDRLQREKLFPRNPDYTLPATMNRLGHSQIELLVLGPGAHAEWTLYQDVVQQHNIRQLVVYLVGKPASAPRAMWAMHDAGYAIFHKNQDFIHARGNMVVYSMIKLAPGFYANEIEQVNRE